MSRHRDPLGYSGRRVVVTGAASGIGRATAHQLVELDAEVHALDRAPIELSGLASRTRCDIGDRDEIGAAAKRIGAVVDGLFCCAGVSIDREALEILTVNFAGARECADRFCEQMVDGGSIVVMGSVAGYGWEQNAARLEPLVSTAGFAEAVEWCRANPSTIEADPYGTSKQAVNLWTRRRAVELVGSGIRVNCVNAGPVETAVLEPFRRQYGDAVLGSFPIGRYAQADEIAAALIWLNSPVASYVTGVGLAVDGGFAATAP